MKLLGQQAHDCRAYWRERRMVKRSGDKEARDQDSMRGLSRTRVRARSRRRLRKGEMNFRRWS